MERQYIITEFFRTLNCLKWEPLETFIDECSIMRIPGHVKVSRNEIIDYFKLYLQDLDNLQIHIQEITENEHSIWVYTDVMPHELPHYTAFWAFKFNAENKIVMLKLYTDL